MGITRDPLPGDRWCELLPDDPCEHKYLVITRDGFVCFACEERVNLRLGELFLAPLDDPPPRT